MRALLTATFLLATLLLGAPTATAAPPTPPDPPDILTPAEPPDPKPCRTRPVSCDISQPTFTAEPTEPSEPTTTSTTPAEPTSTTEAAPSTGSSPDNGLDNGSNTGTDPGSVAGPAETTPPVDPTARTSTNWWLIAFPVLALLALAAAGAFLLIQRTERRPS